MISRACGYAVRTCAFLARERGGSFIPVREIGAALEISTSFLSKIVGDLSRHGIVCAHRGPSGGVALAHPPSTLTVRDIVLAIDGASLFTSCALGLAGCGIEKPCPLHREWVKLRSEIETSFATMTLSSLHDSEGLRPLNDETVKSSPPETDSFIVASSSGRIRLQ